MKLLALETATDICGIAYIHDGHCINLIEEKMPRQHAEVLPLYYNELISKTQLKLADIDAICVSIGPGSFTGLRIGLSYAKGLAYSHQKPIIPVPTMGSLVFGCNNKNSDAVMLISHSNKYFFQSTKSMNSNAKIDVLKLNNIEDLKSIYKVNTIIQYGCDKLFLEPNDYKIISVNPSAKWIGKLAHQNYFQWIENNPYKLIPDYVSPFKIG